MNVDIGLFCYLLALSGIGQVSFSHADRFPAIKTDAGIIEQRGGGGGMVDARTLMFSEYTIEADLWWEPPFAPRYDSGGAYPDRRWHLKKLLNHQQQPQPQPEKFA